jgi:hypothetical protein
MTDFSPAATADRPLPHAVHPKYGDGFYASSPEEIEAAEHLGYQKCHNPKCGVMMSPETQQRIASGPGFYTCTHRACLKTFHLANEWPEYNPSGRSYSELMDEGESQKQNLPYHITGGVRRSGYNVAEVGDIGESVVQSMGHIPGYGDITWWHHGGAASNSPLDGATDEWGIEVKTLDITSLNHRFIAGGRRKNDDGTILDEPLSKMQAALEEGKKGVIALLVVLNFYNSTADVYAKEFATEVGRLGHFYTHSSGVKLLARGLSFANSNLDANHPSPDVIRPRDDIPF